MAGTLIIGGHEDRDGERAILREVADRARGRRVVVATASEDPEEMFAACRKAFNALGVREVVPLQAATREEALDEKAGALVEGAGAVFFTKSLGPGIDEDTAVIVERSKVRVVGHGGVYVVDASGVTFSTVAEAGDNRPLSLRDPRVHVLAPGDKFDLKARRPIQPSEK